MREATKGRAGLPVKDRIVKMFPVGKGVSEMMEEGEEKGGSLVFFCFSSVGMRIVINLLC
jgi:hypothetical protein